MDRYAIECPGVAEADPESETDKILFKKGLAHEKEFLAALKEKGHEVCDVSGGADRFAATKNAMVAGKEIIYQAALQDEEFVGYADFLFKVPGESKLGNYLYEPWDTRLALKAKP